MNVSSMLIQLVPLMRARHQINLEVTTANSISHVECEVYINRLCVLACTQAPNSHVRIIGPANHCDSLMLKVLDPCFRECWSTSGRHFNSCMKGSLAFNFPECLEDSRK